MDEEIWDEVKKAAQNANLKEMISLLFQSSYLDGLERRIQVKFSELDLEDISNIVISAAIEDLYRSIQCGNEIRKPEAYLYKASYNRAILLVTRQRQVIIYLKNEARTYDDFEDPFEGEVDYGDFYLERALEEGRKLVKELGQKNVQMIMNYVFDAIEARNHDVSNEDIATNLGLSLNTVKVSLHRGFQRLSRIAIENHLAAQLLKEAESLINDD